MPKWRGGCRPTRSGGTATQHGPSLPDRLILQVNGTDTDGNAIARPAEWDDGRAPTIFMAAERQGQPALVPGQRVLARVRRTGVGRYEGRTVQVVDCSAVRILGVLQPAPLRGLRLVPADRRHKADWLVADADCGDALPGELVSAMPIASRSYGLKSARVVERLGYPGDAGAISMICAALHDIPIEFPAEAMAQAEAARSVLPDGREDLRALRLVTIDGEDSRDFDDAVFAESRGENGWRVVVAIADVAHYVTPGSSLDRAARTRGNSVYFPDRAIPMLPEALSNDWCSLRPDEDRGCLFVDIAIDKAGRKTGHRFGRGLMRSHARLTYRQVQAMQDADTGDTAIPVRSLFAAFAALHMARHARGTLDFDLPDRTITFDAHGTVLAIVARERLASHRLIEEFMICANVCAAEELEARRATCLHRVHPPPSEKKLEDLRLFLRSLDLSVPTASQLKPADLDRVVRQLRDTDHAALATEIVLRSQSQAAYDSNNIGHFGLALPRYAHFTSPIRRYADLLVHRSLIRALGLGDDGLSDADIDRLAETAQHLTATERRASLAERDTLERHIATHFAERIGASFEACISGVTRSGLFVTLTCNGASGLVPASFLPDDDWMHDQAAQTLTGRRTALSFRLSQPIVVRLHEAKPLTGGLTFQLVDIPGEHTKHARMDRSADRSKPS